MVQGELSLKQLLSKGVCRGKNLRGETDEAFLLKQTHLSLNGRRLHSLSSALAATPKVQVMYLFDNELHSLGGLTTLGLTHLYLQNNMLVDTPELGASLGALSHLQKLYISSNRLADLTPLCGLFSLEELHAGSQRGGGELCLPADLERLSRLRVLSLPQNRLRDVSVLGGCPRLQSIDLSTNLITDMTDLASLLGSTPELHTLDLRSCPVSEQRQMLDAVVVCGASLTHLNGREVGSSQRLYLLALERNGRRVLSPSSGLRGPGYAVHAPPPLNKMQPYRERESPLGATPPSSCHIDVSLLGATPHVGSPLGSAAAGEWPAPVAGRAAHLRSPLGASPPANISLSCLGASPLGGSPLGYGCSPLGCCGSPLGPLGCSPGAAPLGTLGANPHTSSHGIVGLGAINSGLGGGGPSSLPAPGWLAPNGRGLGGSPLGGARVSPPQSEDSVQLLAGKR